MLVSLYVLVDDWQEERRPPAPRKPGKPPYCSLTLRFSRSPSSRSGRDGGASETVKQMCLI
jgi:hypothetical protein